MDETPNAKASKKAKRDMNKAVDKVIDDKKKEPIGTKEAEEKVADDLKTRWSCSCSTWMARRAGYRPSGNETPCRLP